MHAPIPYYVLTESENTIVRFFDHSRRYFGDYHHVRLEARCNFDLSCGRTQSVPGSNDTAPLDHAEFVRTLEKMAVPSASVEEVKGALIEEFRKNTLPYLSSPDFPLKMLSRDAAGKNRKRKF